MPSSSPGHRSPPEADFLARAGELGSDGAPDALLAHARARLDGGLAPAAAWAQLEASDLAVAFGALRGSNEAIATLQRLCGQAARASRVTPAGGADELQQAMLVDLLVSDGRPPRLEQYRGRGSLLGWLRAVAFTTAINLVRGQRLEQTVDDGELETLVDWQTPELSWVKDEARGAFKQAFREALSSLEPKELNMLRLRCFEGVNDGSIAALYKVDRATVVRWMQSTRTKLLLRTRTALGKQVMPTAVDSFIRTLGGELDVSLERFFREPAVR